MIDRYKKIAARIYHFLEKIVEILNMEMLTLPSI
jgi:hypothetical protein